MNSESLSLIFLAETETGERWMLPENATDIHRLADFLEDMSQYRRLASVSSILQTCAIVAVILRLLCLASKHPRVSLITSTLRGSILPMLYFMVPFALVMINFAVMGTVCFGHRVKSLSSFSKAMETVLEFTFFGGGGKRPTHSVQLTDVVLCQIYFRS